MKYCYEEMLPEEFIEAVNRMPVFYVPMGLLEWHADHLPLGLDGLKARGICERVAREMEGGVVLPLHYFGRPGFSSYTGTLTYSEALVTLSVTELLYQLKKVGARIVVLLTGHYGPAQVECVKRVARVFARENPGVSVIALPEYEDVQVDGIEPADHAGMWETALMLALRPELVKMECYREKPVLPKRYSDPPNDYYHEAAEWVWDNDVRSANAELGERAIQAIVDHVCALVRDALKEVNL